MFEIIVEEILKPVLNVQDYWAIYEWQHRGSIHVHMVVWCSDLPEHISDQELEAFFKVTATINRLIADKLIYSDEKMSKKVLS